MGIWMCYSGSASCDEDKASSFSVLQPVVAARKRKLSVEAAKHHYEVLLQRCVSCMVKLVVSMWWNWRWVTEDYNITDTHAGVAAIANDFRTAFKIYGFKDCMLHFNYCQGCLTGYKLRDFLLNISSIYLLVQVCCLGFVLHNTSVCLRLWQTNKQTNKLVYRPKGYWKSTVVEKCVTVFFDE